MTRRVTTLCVLGVLLVGFTASGHAAWSALDQIPVTDMARGFTAATIREGNGHPQANWASCRARTAQMSYRTDGGTATATVGTLLEIGDTLYLSQPWQLVQFSVIRTTATSAQLDCTVGE